MELSNSNNSKQNNITDGSMTDVNDSMASIDEGSENGDDVNKRNSIMTYNDEYLMTYDTKTSSNNNLGSNSNIAASSEVLYKILYIILLYNIFLYIKH